MEPAISWKVQDIIDPVNESIILLVLNNEGQEENLKWMKHLCPKGELNNPFSIHLYHINYDL